MGFLLANVAGVPLAVVSWFGVSGCLCVGLPFLLTCVVGVAALFEAGCSIRDCPI